MPPKQKKSQPRGSHQLPPGRHGLTRQFVESNQRQRMLDAVADVVSMAGYAAMSVEDIIATAGVSRRTFYDNFTSKEDAFLTAYDAIGADLLERVQAAYTSSKTFASGVISCLKAFLEFAASEPRYAEMCIVEALSAGPEAVKRRNAVMKTLAQLLYEGAQAVPGGSRPPELVAETIVGGIYEIVYSRVLQGRAEELPELLPDLAYSMMLPYLGHAAAEREIADLRAETPAAAAEPLGPDPVVSIKARRSA
jgi:AcrR family transcriptional regulator